MPFLSYRSLHMISRENLCLGKRKVCTANIHTKKLRRAAAGGGGKVSGREYVNEWLAAFFMDQECGGCFFTTIGHIEMKPDSYSKGGYKGGGKGNREKAPAND